MLYEAGGVTKFIVVCGYTDRSPEGHCGTFPASGREISAESFREKCFVPFLRQTLRPYQRSSLGRKRVPAAVQALRRREYLLAEIQGRSGITHQGRLSASAAGAE